MRKLGTAVFCAVVVASQASAVLTYDNFTGNEPPNGVWGTSITAFGDDVNLTSTAPITGVSFSVFFNGGPLIPTLFEASLYERMDFNLPTEPTRLWTGAITITPVFGRNTLTFTVPQVQAPTTSLWVVLDYVILHGDDVLMLMGGVPTVGSSSNLFLHQQANGAWGTTSFPELVNNFVIKVEAVPEPATLVTVAVGIAAFRVRRRRR